MVLNPGPENDTALSRFVFTALVDRALEATALGTARGTEQTDPERAEVWRQRAGLDALPGRMLDGVGVVEAVTRDLPSPSLPRLFARGYHDRAAHLPRANRNPFHASMAPLIRWLEEHTPHDLWPEVEYRATETEAGWLREVAAADLGRSAGDQARDPDRGGRAASPWLLSQLEPQGGLPTVATLPGPHLTSRIARLLEEPAHRFAVVRRLAAEARDPRVLRSLAASPAFFEDDDLCVQLLTSGDSAQISCGLHALYLNPGMEPAVATAVPSALESRPFDEVAARVVELHAQASLTPGARPELTGGLVELAGRAAAAGDLGPDGELLFEAMADDARLLRQLFLPADVADTIEDSHPDLAAALRRTCVLRFARTFTPAGVVHPLHDMAFAHRLGGVVSSRALASPESVSDLVALGAGLADLAERLRPEEPETLARQLHAAFARVVLAGARHAWAAGPGNDAALLLYGTVARLAAGPARSLLGSGLLGVLDHRVEPGREAMLTRSLLLEVARLEAGGTIPRDLRRLTDPGIKEVTGSFRAMVEPTARSADDDVPAPISEAALPIPAEPELPVPAEPELPVPKELRIPAWSAGGGRSPLFTLLRLYLGFEALLRVLVMPLRLLGFRRQGELVFDDAQLGFSEWIRFLGVTVRLKRTDVAVDEVDAIRTEPSPTTVYRLFGWGVLIATASVGMVLFFDGLRSSQVQLSVAGASLGLLGLLLDGACHRAWLEGKERSVVTIKRSDGSAALRFRLEIAEAGRLTERLQADAGSAAS